MFKFRFECDFSLRIDARNGIKAVRRVMQDSASDCAAACILTVDQVLGLQVCASLEVGNPPPIIVKDFKRIKTALCDILDMIKC